MASGDSVQQIKDRLSIVDVLSPYVELYPAGKNLKGKSPFTSEKTPSFFVSPDRGMYYCFSTSKGGDMFTFIQEIEGVDFKEALKQLAEKAGVELVPEDPKLRSEREQGYAVLEAATSFFEGQLKSTQAAEQYLKDRGVSAETIVTWRLGYAPGPPRGGWRDTRTHLVQKHFTDSGLIKAGLIKTAGEGKEPYDVFRDRVMFPIFDGNGKVVAFSGRILASDTEAPKYVNSPETAFFNKSEILYGYDKAKQGIRKFDFSLIVEGQFDVVLCHQAGYTNTVAVSGTALTPHHVSLLQRLSNRVVLALDADRAGIAAVKRAADVMLGRGIDIKVARIPEGSDPADIIKANPTDFKHIIGTATHVIEFLLAILRAECTDDRTYKLRVREEVVPYIAKLENQIDADHFETVTAEAIGSSKDAIHAEVTRVREHAAKPPKSVGAVITERQALTVPAQQRHEELLDYLVVVADQLAQEQRGIIEAIVKDTSNTTLSERAELLSSEARSKLTFTIESQLTELSPRQIIDVVGGHIRTYQLYALREQIADVKQKLSEAEAVDDGAKVAEHINSVTALQKKLAAASVNDNPLQESID